MSDEAREELENYFGEVAEVLFELIHASKDSVVAGNAPQLASPYLRKIKGTLREWRAALPRPPRSQERPDLGVGGPVDSDEGPTARSLTQAEKVLQKWASEAPENAEELQGKVDAVAVDVAKALDEDWIASWISDPNEPHNPPGDVAFAVASSVLHLLRLLPRPRKQAESNRFAAIWTGFLKNLKAYLRIVDPDSITRLPDPVNGLPTFKRGAPKDAGDAALTRNLLEAFGRHDLTVTATQELVGKLMGVDPRSIARKNQRKAAQERQRSQDPQASKR